MAPPQLEPPSSLMAVLRGGGRGEAVLDRAVQSMSQAPDSVPAWPPPHHTKVELASSAASPFLWPALLSQFLPCDIFLVLFSLLIFSFGSVFYFLPLPPPLPNFFACFLFSPPLSYLHPHCNTLSDDTACVVFPDQSPGANS